MWTSCDPAAPDGGCGAPPGLGSAIQLHWVRSRCERHMQHHRVVRAPHRSSSVSLKRQHDRTVIKVHCAGRVPISSSGSGGGGDFPLGLALGTSAILGSKFSEGRTLMPRVRADCFAWSLCAASSRAPCPSASCSAGCACEADGRLASCGARIWIMGPFHANLLFGARPVSTGAATAFCLDVRLGFCGADTCIVCMACANDQRHQHSAPILLAAHTH